MDWDIKPDTIHIDRTDITRTLAERPATKRRLQQITSRFYETVGLFSPVAVVGKPLFQGYVDEVTRMGRGTTPGHSRPVAIMDVSITCLV